MLLSTLRRLSSILFCLLFANNAYALDFIDIKFSKFQVADSQWNTSSCYYNPSAYNGCQIYSKNPGIAYKIPFWNGQINWTGAGAGAYVKFEASGNSSYPYTAKVYKSDGTLYEVMGTGKVIYTGTVDGKALFFFMGNDNNTGQVFSISKGLDNTGGFTMVGTATPTTAEMDTYANNYGQTDPLASGELASPGAASTPEPIYSSSITQSQTSRRSANLPATGMEANINIQGNSNLVDIVQAGDAHYLELGIVGSSNAVDIEQASTAGGTHYLEATVNGSNNDLDILQTDTSKTAFVVVNGDHNTLDVVQKDLGNHYLDLTLGGDGHTVDILQEGSGNHNATVDLNNGGGAWDFDLTQSGNTSKEYSLPHAMSDSSTTSGTCYVAAGCTLSVIQND